MYDVYQEDILMKLTITEKAIDTTVQRTKIKVSQSTDDQENLVNAAAPEITDFNQTLHKCCYSWATNRLGSKSRGFEGQNRQSHGHFSKKFSKCSSC